MAAEPKEAFRLVTDLSPPKRRGVIAALENQVQIIETNVTEGAAGDFATYRERVGEIRAYRNCITYLKQAESET